MHRGDLWWATLPLPIGSGPGGRRPVVIIQDDSFTLSRIRTLIIVVVSSNLGLANARGNVLLPSHSSGLTRDSVANVSQILTVDKTLLTDFVATLPQALINKIDDGLRMVMKL